MNSPLIALEAQVRADLAKTAHPDAAWLTPKLGPDDRPALDVLVVGAGQSGLATAFGLMRSQVSNILVLDKSEEGQEGPWLTYARMHTLRSPKHFTGPDLDIPSLTYQSVARGALRRGGLAQPRPDLARTLGGISALVQAGCGPAGAQWLRGHRDIALSRWIARGQDTDR